jgi:GH15 family glucan-1,4-alpha-glucosidase
VVYWKAVTGMAEMAEVLGKDQEARQFSGVGARLKQAINALFWRSDLGYLVTSPRFDNLSSGGNLLAISWGLTTPEQSQRILEAMKAFGMAEPVPTKAAWPPYPRRFVSIENRLGGIPSYHTEAAWLWLGAWHAISLVRVGRLDEAKGILHRLSSVVVRDGEVHEVYGPDGQHLSSFWYTSEAPLTWNAGMIVYAFQVLEEHLQPVLADVSLWDKVINWPTAAASE